MEKRTVYTWVVPYIGKDGQEHWNDGGPYLEKRNAEVRAMLVHAQLTIEKGCGKMKPWFIREHVAPVDQKVMEETFPDIIQSMKEKHKHLFFK